VDDDRNAIGAQVHVELDGVGSELGSELEGCKGVFRAHGGGTAVRDDGAGRKVEQGVHDDNATQPEDQ
jgi:hypothetical protein